MKPAGERFRPDPTLSRAEMEELQRDIAGGAVFTDEFDFDPERVTCGNDRRDGETPPGNRRGEQARLGDATVDSDGSETRDGATTDAPVVAGVDQAFLDDRGLSAVVALRDGEVIERVHATAPLEIDYVPGLLSFREGEAILRAFERLSVAPDLAVFDGSGRIHFRQAGLATHIGVTLDLPAVGVAKNLLCGQPTESVEGLPEGARVPVESDANVDAPDGTVIGYAYQSRQYDSPDRHVNPLYVSPGHRVSAETTVDLVERCCAGYKLPEPTRLADGYADEVKENA